MSTLASFLACAWRPIGSLALILALAAAMFSDRVPKAKFDAIVVLVGLHVLARSYDKRQPAKTGDAT